jgi:hypothetical protein
MHRSLTEKPVNNRTTLGSSAWRQEELKRHFAIDEVLRQSSLGDAQEYMYSKEGIPFGVIAKVARRYGIKPPVLRLEIKKAMRKEFCIHMTNGTPHRLLTDRTQS